MRIYKALVVPGWLLLAALIITALYGTFFPKTSIRTSLPDRMALIMDLDDEARSILDATLPYYRYRQIEDSLRNSARMEDFFSTSYSYELAFAQLGIATRGPEENTKYFVTLSGYKLDPSATVENKKKGSYLRYVAHNSKNRISPVGHFERKPISVRYKVDDRTGDGKIYFALQGNAATSFRIIYYLLFTSSIIIALYALVLIPLRFLFQLAEGRAFTEENIGHLYLTGWFLFAGSIILSLLPMIAHAILSPEMPPEIQFDYNAAFVKNCRMITIGLIVLLFANAFLQGLHLKEEQNLTI